jgi:hypothetical protein
LRIKEGITIFKLTAAEERKFALLAKPDASGAYAFTELLRNAAVTRQFAALPPWSQTPRMLASLEARSHDPSCLAPVLDTLLASMAGSADAPERAVP